MPRSSAYYPQGNYGAEKAGSTLQQQVKGFPRTQTTGPFLHRYVDVKKKAAVSPTSTDLPYVAFNLNVSTSCFSFGCRRSGPELQDEAQPRPVAILHLARLRYLRYNASLAQFTSTHQYCSLRNVSQSWSSLL